MTIRTVPSHSGHDHPVFDDAMAGILIVMRVSLAELIDEQVITHAPVRSVAGVVGVGCVCEDRQFGHA